jgi:hypothetical protein
MADDKQAAGWLARRRESRRLRRERTGDTPEKLAEVRKRPVEVTSKEAVRR